VNPKPPVGWPMWIAKTSSVLVFFTGVAVLLGWMFGIETFKSVLPESTRMAPTVALCFVLAGIGLWCSKDEDSQEQSFLNVCAIICAVAVVLFGLLKLSEQFGVWNLGIDLLGFREPSTVVKPARMANATAVGFVLAGCGLLLAKTSYFKTFQSLLLLNVLVSWVGISRYIFGGEPLLHFQAMAIHTGMSFILLNAGILCLRPDKGLVALLASDSPGGEIARRLVPATLILTPFLGWLRLEGQRAGWYGTEAGISLFALSNIVVFGGLIWANAARLHRVNAERREAEAILRAEQERIQAIVESSDDAIISKSLDGIITTWNRGAEKLFGYTAHEAVGHPMLMLFPPDRANEEPGILKSIADGQSIEHFETVRVRKDGTQIDVSVTLSPLKDGDGKIIGASKIARDITARKQAEIKLQTQLARLDLLNRITRAIGERQDLQSIYQVVIRSLEDHLPIDFGCICLYDDAAKAFTVTRVGVRSEPLAMELTMPEKSHIPIDENGLSRCLQGHLVYEPNLSQSKSPFPLRLARGGLGSLVIAPLLVESHVFGILVVARRQPDSFSSTDCEFLRQLSEQTALAAHQAHLYNALQRAYDDLRQTQQAVMQQERLRALGEMASGVAHDINNSLSPVMLYTGLLIETETNLSASSRKHLETVQRAVSDVAETISRLKEFYRQREPQLTLAPIQLNELAQQVVDLTRARWNDLPQQRGVVIEMRTEFASDLPEIIGAESEIREALINLVFNAADAMPTGGTLTLRTKTSDNKVFVAVADTGTGMSEETRRRCLEPFFTTKGERGTGLGLAMVYGIVQRHSADLEIESELGKGTTISLIFPVMLSTTAGLSATSSAATPLPRMRLLVVDDDPLLLQALRDILEAGGHSVVTANGGQAGIDAFQAALQRNEPFAAVFSDLGMPYIDGRAVAAAVKAKSAATPVILLTGWGKRLTAEGDIPPHVDWVLSKPPKPTELREALAGCFSKSAGVI
jgi:PAS domain S-box-containing protein